MGTKGRDAALWLTFAFAILSLVSGSRAAFYVAVFCGLAFFRHHLGEVPRAERLDYVLLLPVNRHWAGLLARGRIKGRWDRAFEIHIVYKAGVGIREQRDGVVKDLLYIYANRPGLYLWETATSIPVPVRKLIGERAKQGRSFWSKGCFLPRFPLTYRKTNKRLRHGALLITRERRDSCDGQKKDPGDSRFPGRVPFGHFSHNPRRQPQVRNGEPHGYRL